MFSGEIANRLCKAVFEECFSYDATQVILTGIQKALEANGQKLLTPQDLASALHRSQDHKRFRALVVRLHLALITTW